MFDNITHLKVNSFVPQRLAVEFPEELTIPFYYSA